MGWRRTINATTLGVVSLCRVAVAGTLLFSGFVKAADPVGMGYKLNAYLKHWGWGLDDGSLPLVLAAGALGLVEFLLGLYVLLGMRRRLTVTAMLLFASVMTLLTAYIYVYDPVPDCGCFGEAITLTNGQTLVKNIAMLAMVAVLAWKRRYMLRLISERNQWITSLYSFAYIILLTIYSAHYLPPIDFSSFKKGKDLGATYFKGQGSEKDIAQIASLYLTDAKSGEDRTEAVLTDSGYTFLLTLTNVATADDGSNDRINDLYDDCRDRGYAFYAVVPTNEDSADIISWIDRTGAAYPFLQADEGTIKAMVRSNPGLMLLKGGTVVDKWGTNNLPDIAAGNAWKEKDTSDFGQADTMKVVLWYLVPLILIILADRLWIGRKFYKHHIFKTRLKTTIIMRKKIVAGNWKMNKNLQEGIALAKELNGTLAADKPNCGVIICTPFIHLASIAEFLNQDVIGLGAENCADKAHGAYTGEVSAEMVKSTGAQYVILGHSERRAYYHETPEILKEKINLALENGLKVIFCIGEVLEERESGNQNKVVEAQLEGSLFDLTAEQFKNIILAYEPVWAIGTGKTATAEQAEEMHAFIRSVIEKKFGADAAENVTILYGGSCKPGNAKELFAKPNVDGGLIGGAALKAADFKGIIDAWK